MTNVRIKDQLRLSRRSDGISRRYVLLVQFAYRHLVKTGCYPTLKDIAREVGYATPAGAREALQALEALGVVELLGHGLWRLTGLEWQPRYADGPAGQLLQSLVEDGER
jgi:SOS-response transcriptional repressor LexA